MIDELAEERNHLNINNTNTMAMTLAYLIRFKRRHVSRSGLSGRKQDSLLVGSSPVFYKQDPGRMTAYMVEFDLRLICLDHDTACLTQHSLSDSTQKVMSPKKQRENSCPAAISWPVFYRVDVI